MLEFPISKHGLGMDIRVLFLMQNNLSVQVSQIPEGVCLFPCCQIFYFSFTQQYESRLKAQINVGLP